MGELASVHSQLSHMSSRNCQKGPFLALGLVILKLRVSLHMECNLVEKCMTMLSAHTTSPNIAVYNLHITVTPNLELQLVVSVT